MIHVVCWLWPPRERYRSQFNASHVNIFRNMVERHLTVPHEVVCITNIPKGIDERVRIVPLWDTWNSIPSPHGGLSPACYRRLPAFGEHMREVIGERFISMDLDVVITRNFDPIVMRPEDFIIWGSHLRRTPYNGSMWMMNAGARKQIYEEFDPEKTPMITLKAGFHGSDQAWICHRLGPNEATWTPQRDGVYSFRTDVAHKRYALPADARIVFFQGHHDPQSRVDNSRAKWIREHYR